MTPPPGRNTRTPTAAMKVTTLRFGRDLWRLLETEAALVGTSVSQYVREAALARAAAAAGARGNSPFELLAAAGRELAESVTSPRERARIEDAVAVISRAQVTREDARALRAESRQAKRQASSKKARAARMAPPVSDRDVDED